MGNIRIATNFNIDIDFESPPFFKRLLAWILDIIVQIFYIVIATNFYTWLSDKLGYSTDSSYTLWAIGLVLMLPFLLYHLLMEVTLNGQSIGKKITGIKVISDTGGRPSFSQFIIRWLIRTSDYTMLIIIIMIPFADVYGAVIYWGMAGTIGMLVADVILINSEKQQRLGDILAHTVIINTKQRERITDTLFLDVEPDYKPIFPQVMQLSDKDMNALKGIIDTVKKNRDFDLSASAAEKIKKHLSISTQMEPTHFLQTLLKDYNFLSSN